MTKDSVKRAVAKYDAKNTIHIGLKFNKKTDKDILARLSKEPNKQGYIKKLIRADIKKIRNGAKRGSDDIIQPLLQPLIKRG